MPPTYLTVSAKDATNSASAIIAIELLHESGFQQAIVVQKSKSGKVGQSESVVKEAPLRDNHGKHDSSRNDNDDKRVEAVYLLIIYLSGKWRGVEWSNGKGMVW